MQDPRQAPQPEPRGDTRTFHAVSHHCGELCPCPAVGSQLQHAQDGGNSVGGHDHVLLRPGPGDLTENPDPYVGAQFLQRLRTELEAHGGQSHCDHEHEGEMPRHGSCRQGQPGNRMKRKNI